MDIKDNQGIKDKVHIVLRGPDGKVKDERISDEKRETTRKALIDEIRKNW